MRLRSVRKRRLVAQSLAVGFCFRPRRYARAWVLRFGRFATRLLLYWRSAACFVVSSLVASTSLLARCSALVSRVAGGALQLLWVLDSDDSIMASFLGAACPFSRSRARIVLLMHDHLYLCISSLCSFVGFVTLALLLVIGNVTLGNKSCGNAFITLYTI